MIAIDPERSIAISYMRCMPHGVIIYVASGKQGKSATAHSMIRLCWSDRPVWFLDVLPIPLELYPDNYHYTDDINEIPPGSIVVIEDVNRIFGSRGSSHNTLLQIWLPVISHKGLIIIITSQCLSSTDLEFFRSQDCLIIHKRMFNEDIEFERPEFRIIQAYANIKIAEAIKQYPDIPDRAWTFFDRFNECIAMPLVDWFGDDQSFMFRDVPILVKSKGARS